MDGKGLLNEVFNKVANANNELIQIWISHIVFSWRWWLALVLTIIPWIVWVKIRDKQNTVRLMFVGLIVVISTDTLDTIGLSFHLWHYDWTLLPFISEIVPWDFTLLPVAVMLFLQFKPKVNVFIKAMLFAFISAYIVEPLFYYIGLYDMNNWKYIYSFVIYIPLFFIFNYIYKCKLLNKEDNS